MKTTKTPTSWRIALVLSIVLTLAVLGWPAIYVSLAAPGAPTVSAAAYDWFQFNGDAQHSGNNTQETTIARANVGSLGLTWRVSLPGIADGAPAFLAAANVAGGPKDVLFLTTKNGYLVALDAHSGTPVWPAQAHPANGCKINRGSEDCYTTSSPAIDPNRLYVYTYGLDGYVHKHRVNDGNEVTDTNWPQLVTHKPFTEKGSSALTVVTTVHGVNYLYMTSSGYPGDEGDYQGHVTAINLDDGSQRIFNAACSDQTVHFVERPQTPSCTSVQTAIWARAGVVYAPALDRIFMTTGNGDFIPDQHQWGDTVLAIKPDGTGLNGNPLDTYTPPNFVELQNKDLDLGSTAPAIFPDSPGSVLIHVAIQAGKDEFNGSALLRLLNLDDLSGQGGPGHTGGEVTPPIALPQGGIVFTAPAIWRNPQDGGQWAFIVNSHGSTGLQLLVDGNGRPFLQPRWQNPNGGTSPLVANGILYFAGGETIRAVNPLDGHELWHDSSLGGIHWESPVIADGVLYISDEAQQFTAYAPSTMLGPAPAAQYMPYMPLVQK